METNLVLAIEVGNTNTHIGIVDCKALTCVHADRFPTGDIPLRLAASLETVFAAAQCPKTVPVVICSVVKTEKYGISRILETTGFQQPVWFDQTKNFPVAITYDDIKTLGTDRCADCLYGFAAYPGKNQILIDAGTAITVDFLKNGREFAGGTIFPGLTTQLRSLHDHTAGLPNMELDESANTPFPGSSTRGSMAAGVVYGAAGALSFLVSRYREMAGDAVVLATGGAWKKVQNLLTFECIYVPELTIIGTGLYYKCLTGDMGKV
jgi:type III pantothenate kinase